MAPHPFLEGIIHETSCDPRDGLPNIISFMTGGNDCNGQYLMDIPMTDPRCWYINANMTGVYWWDPWSTIYSSTMDPMGLNDHWTISGRKTAKGHLCESIAGRLLDELWGCPEGHPWILRLIHKFVETDGYSIYIIHIWYICILYLSIIIYI